MQSVVFVFTRKGCKCVVPSSLVISMYPMRVHACITGVSQDFNTIENIWKLLNERLMQTLPRKMEGRAEFLPRLRNAVRWLNVNSKEQMLSLSRNQKARADDCLALDGGRTKW